LDNALQRIRSVADYQFGRGVGNRLFPDGVEILFSRSTGRIRYINLNGVRLATLRPTDGLLSISITAAKCLMEVKQLVKCFVTVQTAVSRFIADGGDVFAAHIVRCDAEIRSKDEVIVIDEKDEVLAVGRALLSSIEMLAFKTGVAVKVRHGAAKES
jgi:uncharacterized protein with predicted RNA binding PUA domain